MEGYPKTDDGCPQLLDLIPKDRDWVTERAEETSHGVSEEKRLELTLGPPRGEWTSSARESEGLLSLGPCPQNPVLKSPSPSPWQHHQTHKLHCSYLHLQSGQGLVAVTKESSQLCSNRPAENKEFAAAANASAQKRTAPASVVGWPPIRSFRKNIANGSSSKLPSQSPDLAPRKLSTVENCSKSPLVKINMDGIPIGRKIDLKAYNSYEKLSLAVDELFMGLLSAQKDGCGGGIKDEDNEGKGIGGLLNGSGEYTLVYEDNEGDRMLVGDVPWHMFVSTVKRLRLLRSSELPAMCNGSKQGK